MTTIYVNDLYRIFLTLQSELTLELNLIITVFAGVKQSLYNNYTNIRLKAVPIKEASTLMDLFGSILSFITSELTGT